MRHRGGRDEASRRSRESSRGVQKIVESSQELLERSAHERAASTAYNTCNEREPRPDISEDRLSDGSLFEEVGSSEGVYEALRRASNGATEVLEGRRRNVGRVGFATIHRLVDLSKAGIIAVYEEDDVRVAEVDREITEGWDNFLKQCFPYHLLELTPVSTDHEDADAVELALRSPFDGELPIHQQTRFVCQIAQEIVEFKTLIPVWPIIAGKSTEVPVIPSAKEMRVPIESWFAGIVDLVSEVAKLKTRALEDPSLTYQERVDWYTRYLLAARQILRCLEDVEHTPGNVIDNSTYRGQHFRDGLRRVRRTVGSISLEYVSFLNVAAAQRTAIDELYGRIKE